jgi:transposase-like protein
MSSERQKQGAHLTRETRVAVIDALSTGGASATKIAEQIGVNRGTVYKIRREMMQAGRQVLLQPEAEPQPEPEPMTPAEVHDAEFWRRRSKAIEREAGKWHHISNQLAGVSDQRFHIPEWLMDVRDGKSGRSAVIAHTSDHHMGENIRAEEIQGINAFNPQICRERMKRYTNAVCTLGRRWSADTDCIGVLLTLDGDLTSGDIHEELVMTNALTSHEQVYESVAMNGAMIRSIADEYGLVHVVVTPGNHGRVTRKPTAKRYGALSYDTLIGRILEREFESDKRVTFTVTEGKDAILPVLGRSVLVTHGDKIGTKGGQGFAGPVLPIIRGAKKVMAQRASIDDKPDIILGGHYHTSANPGDGIYFNGSVPGYSEYGDDLRAVIEPPMQWMMLLHSKWGIREKAEIVLTEPAPVEKMRVRVPAQMAA